MSELLTYLLENEAEFRKPRLPALYSDFTSLRTINPDGFQANLKAWKRGLSSALLAGHSPSKSPNRNHFVFELDEALLRSLQSKQYGQPLALGAVLQEAVANGDMIPLQTFMKSAASIYTKTWGGLGWNVMKWGLRQVGLASTPGADSKIPKGQFVVVANLEAGANLFGDRTRERTSRFERTFSNAHFRREFGSYLLKEEDQTLSETDFDVLIMFLSRDKGLLATDGTTIKIRAEVEDAHITEEDSAIASLKELMEDLNKQTDVLSSKIAELSISAQDAVRTKNRVKALAALKSKKLAETNLSRRYATLNQLEEVAAKIEQAADNIALVRVMQSSTVALKNLNDQVGGTDRVDEVIDNLRERMADADEIGNIINEAGPAVVDEAEVDEEFEAMLAEEKKKDEEVERIKKEAEQAKEAEETRKQLAELDKLGPVPVGEMKEMTQDGKEEGEKEKEEAAGKTQDAPPTPATTTAEELQDMNVKERVAVPAE